MRLQTLHPLQEAEAIERSREDWMKMAHTAPCPSPPFHEHRLYIKPDSFKLQPPNGLPRNGQLPKVSTKPEGWNVNISIHARHRAREALGLPAPPTSVKWLLGFHWPSWRTKLELYGYMSSQEMANAGVVTQNSYSSSNTNTPRSSSPNHTYIHRTSRFKLHSLKIGSEHFLLWGPPWLMAERLCQLLTTLLQ